MALPQLTDEQRKAALEKAAAARHARAELRESIKSGKVSLKEVLDSDDPIAQRLKALIHNSPVVDTALMGFPAGWEDDPFWK